MARTHVHYRDYRDLRGDGRIVLYRRADHQNPKWTVRLKVPRTTGFVVRSTKTTDDYEARRVAEDLYYELEGKARRGEPIRSPTFRQVFEQWSRSIQAERDVRGDKYVDGNVRRLELRALKWLGDRQIDTINDGVIADYFDWRSGIGPNPAPLSSIRNERTALNKVFRFARRKGLIRDLPEIKIRWGRPNARPDIPDAEWETLCAHLESSVSAARDARRHRERLYLRNYILILANTGIRVGEARRLRWRDVSSTRTLTGDTRLVFTVRGKTGEREVVCNVGVDTWLDELKTLRRDELARDPSHDEFVFCHPDGMPIGSFKKGFQAALEGAGVLQDSNGRRRVPYSLRHTYATMRLSEGVSVFQLAANMGTSVEMIERFYGKKRVRDPRVATEITKTASQ